MKDDTLLCLWRTHGPDENAKLINYLGEKKVQILSINSVFMETQQHTAVLLRIPADPINRAGLSQLREKAATLCVEFSAIEMLNDDGAPAATHRLENGLIITLLTRTFIAEPIVELAIAALAQQLSIKRFTSLKTSDSGTAIQLQVQGRPDRAIWSSRLAEIRTKYPLDLIVQKDDEWRTRRRMVCFDMDSTLIKAEVIDELAKRAGVGQQVADITERAMQGELDFSQSFTQRMALLNGLPEAVLESVAEDLPLMDGVETLFAGLHQNGFKTAILSGGFNYFANVLQHKLRIDYVFANILEIENGQLTGRAVAPIVDAQRKADLLLELAAKEGFRKEQMVAVGDGANDLLMLDKAGLGVAFRAKPIVREKAECCLSIHGLDGLLYILGIEIPRSGDRIPTSDHA